MTAIVALLLGYLFGSIPSAFLLVRRTKGFDLRATGSGNVGATNAMRAAGIALALLVVAVDFGKGVAAVLVAESVSREGNPNAVVLASAVAGVGAVAGHIYPVWLRFRGGKGVATSFGVFGVLAPVAAAVCLLGFLAVVWMRRYVSLGSIIATSALVPAVYIARAPLPVILAAAITATLVLERHRANFSRLHAGTESRIGRL